MTNAVKYHISKTQKPGVCRAKEGRCPLGNVEHFGNEKLAWEAIENSNKMENNGSFNNGLLKKNDDSVFNKAVSVPDRNDTGFTNMRLGTWEARDLSQVNEIDGIQVGKFISQDGRNETIYALAFNEEKSNESGRQPLRYMRNNRYDVDAIRNRFVNTPRNEWNGRLENSSDNRPYFNEKDIVLRKINEVNVTGYEANFEDENVKVSFKRKFVKYSPVWPTSPREIAGDLEVSYTEVDKKTGDVITKTERYNGQVRKAEMLKIKNRESQINYEVLAMRASAYYKKERDSSGSEEFSYNQHYEKISKRVNSASKEEYLTKIASKYGVQDVLRNDGSVLRSERSQPEKVLTMNSRWAKLDVYDREQEFKDLDIFGFTAKYTKN